MAPAEKNPLMQMYGLVYLGIWIATLVFAVVMVSRLVVAVERIAQALERR